MNDKIKPKRKLGTGHYDRKLMERMVELSVADNYEEASEEWLATGNVYWGDMEIPDWWETPRKCLCGHRIEYHFEVQNEKNGNLILVGSDHINTYHILRHIVAERRQRGEIIHADDITDEMIDEWLSERVASMKQTAWWHAYGQMFEMMFERLERAYKEKTTTKWLQSFGDGIIPIILEDKLILEDIQMTNFGAT
jgi:hypothetical protein